MMEGREGGNKMLIIFCVVIFSLANCCGRQLTDNSDNTISAEAEPLLNISKNTTSQGSQETMASNTGPGSNLNLVSSIHRDIGFQIHFVLGYETKC